MRERDKCENVTTGCTTSHTHTHTRTLLRGASFHPVAESFVSPGGRDVNGVYRFDPPPNRLTRCARVCNYCVKVLHASP